MGTRIGTFFLIVGLFLLLLYGASLGTESVVTQWFLLGALCTALGGFLLFRNRERSPSKRFRTWRRLMSRGQEEE